MLGEISRRRDSVRIFQFQGSILLQEEGRQGHSTGSSPATVFLPQREADVANKHPAKPIGTQEKNEWDIQKHIFGPESFDNRLSQKLENELPGS